jgi:low temperature requirement protein LtrA
VSTLELLLDLVFVFTVSQVAHVVADEPTWPTIGRVVLVMIAVWWMYDAFAWLTNQAVPDTAVVRLLLVAAMAAFLVLSVGLPDALEPGGVPFAVAFMVVAAIHGGLYLARGGAGTAAVLVRVAPLNILVGVPFLVAPLLGEGHDAARWVLALVPVGLIVVAASIARRSPFDLTASHFVERHGLLVIIALGESIVSVGADVGEHGLGEQAVTAILLTVAIIAALWWCYFSGDDERAEHAFGSAPPLRRTSVALHGFYVDHLLMLLGLIALGAGLHLASGEPFAAPEGAAAWLVAGGTAAFLVGDADYRRTLDLGPWVWRLLAAAVCLATVPLARLTSLAVQLVVLTLVVLAAIGVERRYSGRRPAQG